MVLALGLGCRFGGPSGVSDASLVDAGLSGEAGPPVEVALDQAPEATSADVFQESDAACGAPFMPAVCDPVCNTGCPALSRCDVGAAARTGACVGLWIMEEGQACFRGDTTDACAARLTCVQGSCRRLCYRDADCAAGTCCNSILPSGFMVCRPCDQRAIRR
jgi:hypothetical protein